MAHDFALHSHAKTMAKYVNTHGLTLTIQRHKLDKKTCKASKETAKNIFMQRELARGTVTAKHTQSLIFTLLTNGIPFTLMQETQKKDKENLSKARKNPTP